MEKYLGSEELPEEFWPELGVTPSAHKVNIYDCDISYFKQSTPMIIVTMMMIQQYLQRRETCDNCKNYAPLSNKGRSYENNDNCENYVPLSCIQRREPKETAEKYEALMGRCRCLALMSKK